MYFVGLGVGLWWGREWNFMGREVMSTEGVIANPKRAYHKLMTGYNTV